MIRLMGILTGSAIAVGILIVGLGMPDFSAPQSDPAESLTTYQPAAKTAASASSDVAIPSGTEAEAQSRTEAKSETSTETQSEIQRPTVAPNNTIETPPLETRVAAIDTESIAPTEPALPIGQGPKQPQTKSEANWYAFWSPFRSEIAADGFVAQLQRTTGLDYRVVKLKPGVYEVAFAYLDEGDIQDKLARISTATGLDLSGG